MRKYRVSHDAITAHEVIRETDYFITYLNGGREDREGKWTEYAKWFDGFDQAKQHLLDKWHKEIELYQYRIQQANKMIERINSYHQ